MPLQPHRQVADRDARAAPRTRAPPSDRDRERQPGVQRDQPGAVRRAAPERGVPERQQPGEAQQQVHRRGEQRPAGDVQRDRRIDHPGQRRGRRPARGPATQRPASARRGPAVDRITGTPPRCPNSPAGRHSSTTAIRMNTSVWESAGTYRFAQRRHQPDGEAGGDRAEDRAEPADHHDREDGDDQVGAHQRVDRPHRRGQHPGETRPARPRSRTPGSPTGRRRCRAPGSARAARSRPARSCRPGYG